MPMETDGAGDIEAISGAGDAAAAKEEDGAAEERLEVKLKDLDKVVEELILYSNMKYGDENRLVIRHALMHR